jgi:hypothetical protein
VGIEATLDAVMLDSILEAETKSAPGDCQAIAKNLLLIGDRRRMPQQPDL